LRKSTPFPQGAFLQLLPNDKREYNGAALSSTVLSFGIKMCFAPALSFTGPDLSTWQPLEEALELSGTAFATPVCTFLDGKVEETLLT
jgi:hypothetical protein